MLDLGFGVRGLRLVDVDVRQLCQDVGQVQQVSTQLGREVQSGALLPEMVG